MSKQIRTKSTGAPRGGRAETKRPVVQMMSGVAKKSVPAAPPVYRPQPVPRVLQKKELATCKPAGACRHGQPTRSGVSPKPVTKVLQRRIAPAIGVMPDRPALGLRGAAIQRAMAPPRRSGSPPPGPVGPPPPPAAAAAAAAAAAVTCSKHPDVYLDDYGDCYECVVDREKVQQKPDKVKKKAEVCVTMEEWTRDNSKAAADLLRNLNSTQITHRGNKAPKDPRHPTAQDLVNHDASGAPVWFTVGSAATSADIEKYKYHHVLTLNRRVDVIINANLRQTLNHSEGASGESTWTGYLVKSNEGGCFAVSLNTLETFYRTCVTRHELR